ncbi:MULTISPECIES: 2'-5' RNA ligase family protein [Halomicrobium]|nr:MULTISPECIES: 2'-5' RNA ligase family protein [Halomicrobium]QCD65397.1 2'-5' RNA ligase family protein [Halomicrobium mukohataei]QFR20203.1 2'-5' RNA ligase family protein [Halomicrobium sp. ZPS1]
MFSLNVPIPGDVARLASDLAREWPSASPRPRGEHSMVAKRLATDDHPASVVEARAREVLADQPAVAVRITGVDWFAEPTSGTAPVVYLAVESPGLHDLHRTLCDAFHTVPRLEGEEYTPHVTVARGGDRASGRRLLDRDIEPIEWVVDELAFYDAARVVESGRVSLG